MSASDVTSRLRAQLLAAQQQCADLTKQKERMAFKTGQISDDYAKSMLKLKDELADQRQRAYKAEQTVDRLKAMVKDMGAELNSTQEALIHAQDQARVALGIATPHEDKFGVVEPEPLPPQPLALERRVSELTEKQRIDHQNKLELVQAELQKETQARLAAETQFAVEAEAHQATASKVQTAEAKLKEVEEEARQTTAELQAALEAAVLKAEECASESETVRKLTQQQLSSISEAKDRAEALLKEEKAARINMEASKKAEEQIARITLEEDQLRLEAELEATNLFRHRAEDEIRCRSQELREAESIGRELEQALFQAQEVMQRQAADLQALQGNSQNGRARAEQLPAGHGGERNNGNVTDDAEVKAQQARNQEVEALSRIEEQSRLKAEEAKLAIDMLLRAKRTPAQCPQERTPVQPGVLSETPGSREFEHSMSPEPLRGSSPTQSRSPSRFSLMKKAQFYARRHMNSP